MSSADFSSHWLHVHGSLVKAHGAAMGYRMYVQSHRLESPELRAITRRNRWHDGPLGGMTEVWWDSADSMAAAMGSEAGQRASAALALDEQNFVHAPGLTAFLAQETRR